MRNVLVGIAVMTIFLIVTAIVMTAVWTLAPTVLMTKDRFEGILPLRKSVTNVIIVHGIGAHCIGYSDPLLLNLVKQIPPFEAEPMQ